MQLSPLHYYWELKEFLKLTLGSHYNTPAGSKSPQNTAKNKKHFWLFLFFYKTGVIFLQFHSAHAIILY